MNQPAPASHTKSPAALAARLRPLCDSPPSLAIVLGSGFQAVAARVRPGTEIPYADLPGFVPARVSGHEGKLVLGRLSGTAVAMLCGRVHYYEGHTLEQVTFPVRALAELGVSSLLLTNAAGGINRKFRPGHFMSITDHINFMGTNPLRGEAPPGRERFVDLTQVYDPGLRRLLEQAAAKIRLRLHTGVYLAVSGPSYETPAEIRAFAKLGADAVGMSTVPEAIVARQCGLRVAGLSCITNLAAGRQRGPLSHAEVLATGERIQRTAAALLEEFARRYGTGN